MSFSEGLERMAAWAKEHGLEALLVEVRCSPETAIARLARREAEGRDPSDAGPSLYHWSARHFEPPDEWPADRRIVVESDAPDWRAALYDAPGIAKIA